MNTAFDLRYIRTAKTHRVREKEISWIHATAFLLALWTNTFIRLVYVFPAFFYVSYFNPIDTIGIMRYVLFNRAWRTAANDIRNIAQVCP